MCRKRHLWHLMWAEYDIGHAKSVKKGVKTQLDLLNILWRIISGLELEISCFPKIHFKTDLLCCKQYQTRQNRIKTNQMEDRSQTENYEKIVNAFLLIVKDCKCITIAWSTNILYRFKINQCCKHEISTILYNFRIQCPRLFSCLTQIKHLY